MFWHHQGNRGSATHFVHRGGRHQVYSISRNPSIRIATFPGRPFVRSRGRELAAEYALFGSRVWEHEGGRSPPGVDIFCALLGEVSTLDRVLHDAGGPLG